MSGHVRACQIVFGCSMSALLLYNYLYGIVFAVMLCCCVLLYSFFQKFVSEEGATPLLDTVTDFAKHLFRIPIPPHGRIAVVSSEYVCINSPYIYKYLAI